MSETNETDCHVAHERDALRALVVAVIPHCRCGRIATYHVRHRYADPHNDCDDCRVAYVTRASETYFYKHTIDLDADGIDSADSWGKKLPYADAARVLNRMKTETTTTS